MGQYLFESYSYTSLYNVLLNEIVYTKLERTI